MGGIKAGGTVSYTPLVRAFSGETENPDICTESGSYRVSENAQGCPITGAPLFVIGAKACVRQYVFDCVSGSAVRRDTIDGGVTWKPWEWENPPVADGAEYRTTKRRNGKVVYAKMITVESAPNSATEKFPHGLEGILPASWEGIATNGEHTLSLPFCNSFTVGVDETNITISTTEDYSGYAVEITIEYCKEENE